MSKNELKKCPEGVKGCKAVKLYKYENAFFCSGYVKKTSYKKVDKIRLCIWRKGGKIDIYAFAPDEAMAITDIITHSISYFLLNFKPYLKWRNME